MSRIVVIDDEEGILNVLGGVLTSDGHEVQTLRGDDQLLESLKGVECDILLTDLKMGAVSGMDVLRHMHEAHPDVPVIILTGFGTMEAATEAEQLGVFDMITKPFKIDQLNEVIDNALAYKRDSSSDADLRALLGAAYRLDRTVCESDSMHRVCDMVERTAPLDMPVLVQGAVGTGREQIAQEVHKGSSRRSAGVHVAKCGADSEMRVEADIFGYVKDAFPGADADTQGALAEIDGGTLILDDIDNLSSALQERLLKLITDKTYTPVGGKESSEANVRVVATASSNLQEMAASGGFNKDLVNRLSILTIDIKPLSERPEDVLYIAYDILTDFALEGKPFKSLSAAAAKAFTTYNWPGNAGEMREALTAAMESASGDSIDVGDLPGSMINADGQQDANSALDSLRGKYLRQFIGSQG